MMRRTSRTVLGILDQAGPVLIRASEDADKASSQDMAVLGSVVTYAEGLGVQFGSVATEDFRIGFNRASSSLLMTLITNSKLHSAAQIKQFLQVVHLAVQMLVGPNELAIIAAANTAHDNLRRALIGYAAMTYDNVYVLATPCFWRLHPHELLVMQLLLHSLPASSTTAEVPLHLPHSAANEPWSMLMVTLAAGCRLVVLTKGQTPLALAQRQTLLPKSFDSLRQPLLQARDHTLSCTLLSQHRLLAFVLHQNDPDCVMLSSCPSAAQAPSSPVTHGMNYSLRCELRTGKEA
ncbi:hypothetical protein ABBQ32_001525 [Trebouxia sp. C0010 RCD-2024]